MRVSFLACLALLGACCDAGSIAGTAGCEGCREVGVLLSEYQTGLFLTAQSGEGEFDYAFTGLGAGDYLVITEYARDADTGTADLLCVQVAYAHVSCDATVEDPPLVDSDCD